MMCTLYDAEQRVMIPLVYSMHMGRQATNNTKSFFSRLRWSLCFDCWMIFKIKNTETARSPPNKEKWKCRASYIRLIFLSRLFCSLACLWTNVNNEMVFKNSSRIAANCKLWQDKPNRMRLFTTREACMRRIYQIDSIFQLLSKQLHYL